MAMHLSQTEVDKARSVAQQALKTVSFRDQGDRLNVWKALMVCNITTVFAVLSIL